MSSNLFSSNIIRRQLVLSTVFHILTSSQWNAVSSVIFLSLFFLFFNLCNNCLIFNFLVFKINNINKIYNINNINKIYNINNIYNISIKRMMMKKKINSHGHLVSKSNNHKDIGTFKDISPFKKQMLQDHASIKPVIKQIETNNPATAHFDVIRINKITNKEEHVKFVFSPISKQAINRQREVLDIPKHNIEHTKKGHLSVNIFKKFENEFESDKTENYYARRIFSSKHTHGHNIPGFLDTEQTAKSGGTKEITATTGIESTETKASKISNEQWKKLLDGTLDPNLEEYTDRVRRSLQTMIERQAKPIVTKLAEDDLSPVASIEQRTIVENAITLDKLVAASLNDPTYVASDTFEKLTQLRASAEFTELLSTKYLFLMKLAINPENIKLFVTELQDLNKQIEIEITRQQAILAQNNLKDVDRSHATYANKDLIELNSRFCIIITELKKRIVA